MLPWATAHVAQMTAPVGGNLHYTFYKGLINKKKKKKTWSQPVNYKLKVEPTHSLEMQSGLWSWARSHDPAYALNDLMQFHVVFPDSLALHPVHSACSFLQRPQDDPVICIA